MAKTRRTAAAREAWAAIHALMFSDENHDRMHDACEAVGLTPGLMKALLSLQPGEAKPMRALADEWRCDASNVTGLVDGLEQRGIVERRILPADRRVKTVVLTPLGQKTKERLAELLHQPPSGFGRLSPAEQRTLRDLLGKVSGSGS